MGKDCGSWFHQQHLPWQSPNLNRTSAAPDLGAQNIFSACTNPYTPMVSANGSLLGSAVSQLPHFKMGQTNELHPHGWFYCLPSHHQVSTPSPNTVLKEKLSPLTNVCGEEAKPNAVSASVQKRFLVFNQSGNQASMIYSSAIGSPVQHLSCGNPKPFDSYRLIEETATKRDLIYQAGPVISNGLNENQETGDGSEMHEDTEELDALLYSDDESDYDDEETSTGHSPSEMTVYKKQEEAKGSGEEVGSSAGGTKRKRLLEDEEHGTSSLMDTASSVKPNGSWEYEDDAESSCVKGGMQEGEMDSLPANKRLRRERIRETVSILQSIIPGGKGKDAILVLDEAIQYLRSLKLKAKYLGASLK